VRRWTGGGLVEHGGERDYTFSLGIPAVSGEPMRRPAESYQRIHVALLSVLGRLGIDAELVPLPPAGSTSADGGCFVSPVEADIVSSSTGEKLVGGAQRRSKSGMLHQGSIHGLDLPIEVAAMFAEALADTAGGAPIPCDVIDRAAALAGERYPDL